MKTLTTASLCAFALAFGAVAPAFAQAQLRAGLRAQPLSANGGRRVVVCR